MYTTCMHALRTHFLPATGLYGLARGSAAAAQRFAGSHAPLRGVFYAGFCAFKAVALRCAGAGANAAAPLRARKAMTAFILDFKRVWSLRWQSGVFMTKPEEMARCSSCIGYARVKIRCP